MANTLRPTAPGGSAPESLSDIITRLRAAKATEAIVPPPATTLPMDWSRYLGGGDATTGVRDMAGTTTEGWQDALNWVKQFDPNASIQGALQPGGEGGQYLAFNNALLPKNVLGGRGIEGIARMPGSGERLAAPNAVINDPIFGQVTTPQNLREKGPSMVDILGPLIVGGLAGIGGGGLGLLGNAMTKAPSMLSNIFSRGSTITPQQLMLLRLLSMRGGGGNG